MTIGLPRAGLGRPASAWPTSAASTRGHELSQLGNWMVQKGPPQTPAPGTLLHVGLSSISDTRTHDRAPVPDASPARIPWRRDAGPTQPLPLPTPDTVLEMDLI